MEDDEVLDAIEACMKKNQLLGRYNFKYNFIGDYGKYNYLFIFRSNWIKINKSKL